MPIISGIQQIGVGVPDVNEAFKWYRQNFGFDVPIFDDRGAAGLMLPYTGGVPQIRHAVLAVNMQGGGGLEIWQYISRKPQPAPFGIMAGDLGIYAAKLKCRDIPKAYEGFTDKKLDLCGGIVKDPAGNESFFIKDPYGNMFQAAGCSADDVFTDTDSLTGGICGAVIGVADIDEAVAFYRDILEYDNISYNLSGRFDDLGQLPGGGGEFKRALLTQDKPRKGPFGEMLGSGRVELIQAIDRKPAKIFENRYWGDLGFIHLCFDIQGMDGLKGICAAAGHQFTVDSNPGDASNSTEAGNSKKIGTFDMGEASGRFAYAEDPGGTLIEFVETHKIPILKKLGLYLDTRKRDPERPLPRWMLKTLGWNRIKN